MFILSLTRSRDQWPQLHTTEMEEALLVKNFELHVYLIVSLLLNVLSRTHREERRIVV